VLEIRIFFPQFENFSRPVIFYYVLQDNAEETESLVVGYLVSSFSLRASWQLVYQFSSANHSSYHIVSYHIMMWNAFSDERGSGGKESCWECLRNCLHGRLRFRHSLWVSCL